MTEKHCQSDKNTQKQKPSVSVQWFCIGQYAFHFLRTSCISGAFSMIALANGQRGRIFLIMRSCPFYGVSNDFLSCSGALYGRVHRRMVNDEVVRGPILE